MSSNLEFGSMKEPFRPTGRISVSLLLALCFAVGCSEGGIERSPNDVPIFHGVVDLEIGEIEGEDPYLLTRIESIVEDARGRLIVADLQSHDVRIFGSEGDFLFRFGGQGEGPGELTQPCCLAFGPDGNLWVREASRYSVFRLAGAGAEYDRGVRIAHGGVGMVAPVTFDTEGRLVDIGP
ncbi:MAG: 6-bladed beta-propeller, partial [Gammaproteobacteria bacterium]|nr:6-bladed beta-propeller [Gammaproteobacteria bacterium]